MRALLTISSAALLGGCLTDGFTYVSVNELRGRPGNISFLVHEDTVSIELNYVVPTLDSCVRLDDDITATIGGVEMEVDRGGADENRECLYPKMRAIRPPRAPLTDFVIADGDNSITCSLGDALADRGPVLVSPAAWELARGQPVTLRWEPATDFTSYDVKPRFDPTGATPGTAQSVMPNIAPDGVMTFEVPTTVFPGAYELAFTTSIKPRNYQSQTQLSCELEATLSLYDRVAQPVRITP